MNPGRIPEEGHRKGAVSGSKSPGDVPDTYRTNPGRIHCPVLPSGSSPFIRGRPDESDGRTKSKDARTEPLSKTLPGIDFDAVALRFPLEEVAARFVELRKVGNELHGPCPFCNAGTDRFRVNRLGWCCRRCERKGKDSVSLYAAMFGIGMGAAAKALAGRELPTAAGRAPVPRVAPTVTKEAAPRYLSPDWQEKARRIVADALARGLSFNKNGGIDTGPCAKLFESYLASRGLSLNAALHYRLGYDPEVYDRAAETKRPALVLPHVTQDGTVTAVKFRFTDALAKSDKARRFSMLAGSSPALFGLHQIEPHRRLVVVEGELNAVAVASTPGLLRADVVSIGSESASPLALDQLRAIARGYDRAVLWLDDPDKLDRVCPALPGAARMKSPWGKDAADILTDPDFGGEALRALVLRNLES